MAKPIKKLIKKKSKPVRQARPARSIPTMEELSENAPRGPCDHCNADDSPLFWSEVHDEEHVPGFMFNVMADAVCYYCVGAERTMSPEAYRFKERVTAVVARLKLKLYYKARADNPSLGLLLSDDLAIKIKRRAALLRQKLSTAEELKRLELKLDMKSRPSYPITQKRMVNV